MRRSSPARWRVTCLLQREQGPEGGGGGRQSPTATAQRKGEEAGGDGFIFKRYVDGRKGLRGGWDKRLKNASERGGRETVLLRAGHWCRAPACPVATGLCVGHCCHRNAPGSTRKQNSGAIWSGETNNIWLLFLICVAAVSYSLRETRYRSAPLRQRKNPYYYNFFITA